MKIKYAIIAATILVAGTVTSMKTIKKSTPLFEANVEALADSEGGTMVYYACKYLGCCGGENKCFTGSITIGGVKIEGTFYMQ